MAKPKKTTPTGQFDPKAIKKLKGQKSVDRMQGRADAADGRDTRMSRDGGTNRRTRR